VFCWQCLLIPILHCLPCFLFSILFLFCRGFCERCHQFQQKNQAHAVNLCSVESVKDCASREPHIHSLSLNYDPLMPDSSSLQPQGQCSCFFPLLLNCSIWLQGLEAMKSVHERDYIQQNSWLVYAFILQTACSYLFLNYLFQYQDHGLYF